MVTITPLSASKQSILIHLRKSHFRKALLIFRPLSSDATQSLPPPPPPPEPPHPEQQNDESIIRRAVQLLQAPDTEWDTAQLNHALSSTSPPILLRITRHLRTSSHAFKFLQFLQNNSCESSPATIQSLSSTFQAIFELASREPESQTNLSRLYKTSKELSIPLTFNAAKLLLYSLGRTGLVEESLNLFNELDCSIKNTHVCNVLLRILLEAGRVEDAFKVLDEMFQLNDESDCVPDDVTGNILFSSLTRRERLGRSFSDEEIVDLVLKCSEHGVFPDSIWIGRLITRLCRNSMGNRAWDLLFGLVKAGVDIEVASFNALLTGFGRDGDFKRMNQLTEKMKEMDIQPNVITFGILINHLCKVRRVDNALEVFEKMSGNGEVSDGVLVEPDIVIYNTLIDGLCKVGRQEEGLRLMAQMRLEKGCGPNTVTYNCLIDAFCKTGEMETARELFDEMNIEGILPNVITVNTLIDGMCRHGRINSAVKFFGEMQRKGLKGNAFTYTSFIKAFCNVNNIDKAFEYFNEMLRARCPPDAIVYYALIEGLTQAGRMDDASSIFSKLKEAGFRPDTLCYNVLIGGFCRRNKYNRAFAIVKEMEEAGVKPDVVTYTTLISYFSKAGDIETACRTLKKMIKEGLVPTVVTYGALINGCCLIGDLDEANKIFKDMEEVGKVLPNTVICNMLIDTFCKNNRVEDALSLMKDMENKGVRPNATTYNAMFKGLVERRWLDEAIILMDKMTEQGCNPDYITMGILTEWLPVVGETEKLKRFARGQKVSASTS